MTNTITSVSDYLKKLKTIAVDEDSQLFYRGLSNEEYATPENNIPSIYRNKGWIENEDKMFYELVSRVPEEFKDCQNTFEYLVKMQHYGYPTRLLDVTSNPLVALYFACVGDEKENQKDGAVILFSIRKNEIRNYESDTVALVSNLTLINRKLLHSVFIFNELRQSLINLLEHVIGLDTGDSDAFLGIFTLVLADLSPNLDLFIVELKKLLINKDDHKDILIHVSSAHVLIINLISSLFLYCDQRVPVLKEVLEALQLPVNDRFNQLKRFLVDFDPENIDIKLAPVLEQRDINLYKEYIQGQLRSLIDGLNMKKTSKYFYDYDRFLFKNKPGWNSDKIVSQDLIDTICVIPKHDNSRIIAQQGAFLLFSFSGYGESILTKPNMEKTAYNSDWSYFKIPQSFKKDIINELYTLGISSSVLFPEIESVTKEIKDRYAKD